MSTWLRVVTTSAAVGAGCIGGVFFAFSAFVMPALGRLPTAAGVAAMQSINVTAVRAPLMGVLFGTAACCVASAVGGLVEGTSRALLVGGAAAYVLGAVVLTAGYHVPLNDRLMRADPQSPDAVAQWTHYLVWWTRWNWARAAASLVAAAVLVAALQRG